MLCLKPVQVARVHRSYSRYFIISAKSNENSHKTNSYERILLFCVNVIREGDQFSRFFELVNWIDFDRALIVDGGVRHDGDNKKGRASTDKI